MNFVFYFESYQSSLYYSYVDEYLGSKTYFTNTFLLFLEGRSLELFRFTYSSTWERLRFTLWNAFLDDLLWGIAKSVFESAYRINIQKSNTP